MKDKTYVPELQFQEIDESDSENEFEVADTHSLFESTMENISHNNQRQHTQN